MMRILLVQGNRPEGIAPVFPLGLAYLAGTLRETGHQVKGFDAISGEDRREELKKSILEFCPDVVGISIRNLDNQRCYDPISFLPDTREVIDICRQSSKAKIVVGGSGFSIAPEQLVEYFDADAGIAGEGETAFRDLVRALEEGFDISRVPGIVMPRWQKSRAAKPDRIRNLDSLPPPDREVFKAREYLQQGIMLNVRTKRGCPFRCIYCTTPQIEGREMRMGSPRRVVDELEKLVKDYGANEFYFTDNIFNYPAGHAESLCEEIIARDLRVRWYCIANPCSLSRDLLRLMRRAGCYGLSLGNETGSPSMLRRLRKNFTVEQVRQCGSYCRELGIDCTCFLLLGGPGESRKTVEESVSMMERLKPSSVSITVGIRIYPNTELARIAREEGVLDANGSLLPPTFYLSGETREWIFDYVRAAADRNGWTFRH